MASGLSIKGLQRSGKEIFAALFVSNMNEGKPFKLKDSGDPGTWVNLWYDSDSVKRAWNKKPQPNWSALEDKDNQGRVYVVLDGPHDGSKKVNNPSKYLDTQAPKTKNGKDWKLLLSELEKTKAFGSSTGSGGGSDATTLTESMCCYFAAYLFNNGPAKFRGEEILNAGKFIEIKDDKDILKYGEPLSKFFKAHSNLVHTYDKQKRIFWDDCWTFAAKEPVDKKWMKTYINTANVLYDKATNWLAPVYFYRGSKFVEKIYEKKNNCQKHDRELGVVDPVANMMNDDKWNPADIWMSTLSVASDPFPWKSPTDTNDHACDWLSLKSAVAVAGQDSSAQERTLGISLKKQSETAHVSEWNPSEFDGEVWAPKRLKNKTVKYRGFCFGNGDFFGSTDVYLYFLGAGSPKIQYRAFDGTAQWQGQMTGVGQAGAGKLSGTPTNYYSDLKLGKNIGKAFPSYVNQDPWKEYKGSYPYPEGVKKKMWELYKEYNDKQTITNKTRIKVGKEGSKRGKYEGLKLPPFKANDNSHRYWKPIKDEKDFQVWESKEKLVTLEQFKILADNYYNEKGKRLAVHNFWFGKYMALALIDNIEKSRNKHAFSRDIVRYAMSNASDISTYFWKVS